MCAHHMCAQPTSSHRLVSSPPPQRPSYLPSSPQPSTVLFFSPLSSPKQPHPPDNIIPPPLPFTSSSSSITPEVTLDFPSSSFSPCSFGYQPPLSPLSPSPPLSPLLLSYSSDSIIPMAPFSSSPQHSLKHSEGLSHPPTPASPSSSPPSSYHHPRPPTSDSPPSSYHHPRLPTSEYFPSFIPFPPLLPSIDPPLPSPWRPPWGVRGGAAAGAKHLRADMSVSPGLCFMSDIFPNDVHGGLPIGCGTGPSCTVCGNCCGGFRGWCGFRGASRLFDLSIQ
eukprot:GHVS01108239.1.p1 GENE.GHVS01108239.1~~GHVS01108239.1.p1  ORF type:complete len:279 (+),score=103.47 GHVS01108239.1:142-978(+)